MTTHTGNQIREAASTYGHLNEGALPVEALRRQAPAVFATQASEKTGRRYTFIPTGRVMAGLMDAGFVRSVPARPAAEVGSSTRGTSSGCGGGSRRCSSGTRCRRSCC